MSRARPASVIQASVGPGRPSTVAHLQVVVGAEEGVEAELLGAPGDGEQVVVGGALLGLGEDAELHAGRRTVAVGPARRRHDAAVRRRCRDALRRHVLDHSRAARATSR